MSFRDSIGVTIVPERKRKKTKFENYGEADLGSI